MTTQTTRRKFLKTGCLATAAGGIVLCGSGAAVATIRPKIEMPSTTIGEMIMDKRVLVTYASKAGSTAEIAAKISEAIARRGFSVDLLPVNTIGDLAAYQAVVVGTAIRAGSVLHEAKAFIEKNRAALAQMPFSLFIGCLTLAEDTQENRKTASAYLDPLRALVMPANEGMFAGVMNLKKLSLIERLIMKMMKSPEGDFRDWARISAWAEEVPLG
jgi:menaquinone-dependent protoporphyrinogen oxidase